MKKLLGAVTLAGILLPMSANAHDHNPPGGADCGKVGSSMMKGETGLVSHLLGATIDATFMGSALYGMTTGTLGCDVEGAISPIYASLEQRRMFVQSNFDSLAHDAASGNGAYVAALASLIGIEEKDKLEFYSVMKDNYTEMFSTESSDEITVMATLDHAMLEHEQLQKYVAHSHD